MLCTANTNTEKAVVTYLSNAMKQSPSLEANTSSASQEIPRIFWEPEGSLPHSQEPLSLSWDRSAAVVTYFMVSCHFLEGLRTSKKALHDDS
jgi:hypothetical protein